MCARKPRRTSCSPTGAQLRQVLSVVIPTAVYVAVMPCIGIYVSSVLLIAFFMTLARQLRLAADRGDRDRRAARHLRRVRAVVPGAAAEGADRSTGSDSRTAAAPAEAQRSGSRGVDPWKNSPICFTASPSRCSRSTSCVMVIGIVLGVLIGVLPGLGGANGVAILLPLTFSHVADLGDHHAVLHLLGRAVRRRHHLDPVQHSGRTMVGGDHVRRPSDGAAGQGRRGADRGLHLVLRRRAVRRHHDHAGRAAGRAVSRCNSARRRNSRSISSPSAASSA